MNKCSYHCTTYTGLNNEKVSYCNVCLFRMDTNPSWKYSSSTLESILTALYVQDVLWYHHSWLALVVPKIRTFKRTNYSAFIILNNIDYAYYIKYYAEVIFFFTKHCILSIFKGNNSRWKYLLNWIVHWTQAWNINIST